MLVEEAMTRIKAISDVAVRDTYVRALRNSMMWDGVSDGHLPTSAESVVAITGVDASVLENNLILLSKIGLSLYASEIGVARTLVSIQKKLTATSYEKLLADGRTAVRSGRKLLITYAEARLFLGVRSPGHMPN